MKFPPESTVIRLLAALCVVAAGTVCQSCGDPEHEETPQTDAAGDAGADMPTPLDAGMDAATPEDAAGPDAAGDMPAPDVRGDVDSGTPDAGGEVCDNGEDDDGDGDTDCRDSDCDAAPECRASAIATGWTHACAAFEDGRVRCWGDDSEGALGDPGTEGDPQPPVRVEGIDDAVDVVAGEGFSCALHEDQTVSCWGSNEAGQLGDASFIDSPVPVSVTGIGDATALAAGKSSACAVSSADGEVFCWGDNAEGQLGDGSTDPSNEPVGVDLFALLDVVDLVNANDVECGFTRCCATFDDETAACWGRNANGGLAAGVEEDFSDLALPVLRQTGPAESLRQVAAAGVAANFTCFAKSDNTVWCAGEVPALQRDYPGSPELPDVAVELDLFADGVDIWGGVGHACALRTSGRVLCWGDNGQNQTGDPEGGFSDGYQLTDAQDPRDVDTGDRFTCYADADGEAFCFGNNEFRQLGSDTSETAVAEPQRVRW